MFMKESISLLSAFITRMSCEVIPLMLERIEETEVKMANLMTEKHADLASYHLVVLSEKRDSLVTRTKNLRTLGF